MKTTREKNLKIDRKYARIGKSHAMHVKRREPTLYLLQRAYDDGCRTLLDIGCNGGLWMEKTREMGYIVTGLDHTPYASADIVQDANDLTTLEDNSYDAIQITEVMEHLDTHPTKTLSECKRIARHSIIISVPGKNAKWGGEQAKNTDRLEKINYHTHVWYIPKTLFSLNACIVDDVSGDEERWCMVRVRV